MSSVQCLECSSDGRPLVRLLPSELLQRDTTSQPSQREDGIVDRPVQSRDDCSLKPAEMGDICRQYCLLEDAGKAEGVKLAAEVGVMRRELESREEGCGIASLLLEDPQRHGCRRSRKRLEPTEESLGPLVLEHDEAAGLVVGARRACPGRRRA